ncbi:thiaminase [Actinopolyspora biskrensis]|uniref:Thiaminase n=1 Tax=Actinopolyspora biskrensis TaxID=1470178 RepID=A0A852YVF1_9ACTN|nr:hypothetical protein [Actinopolyspora biskrensis]NYH77702.1 thiaminase [Actinopolyspora biskrensis]
MAGNTTTDAERLVERVRTLRTEQPVGNALLDRLRDDTLTVEHLKRFVAVEEKAHHAELAVYGLFMTRFPYRPAVDFYAKLSELIAGAQPKLLECAGALGMDEGDMLRWPPQAETYAFNSTLSWIALTGSQASGALALHTDMTIYFSGCADIAAGVRQKGIPVPEEFFTYYDGGHSDELMRQALETVQDGLNRGDDPDEAVFRARLLEESIGGFWRAAANTRAE